MRIKVRSRQQTASQKAQLELGLRRYFETDRNFEQGGRSFYFFDFDDNIAILNTPTYIFHKESGREVAMSSREFVEAQRQIGLVGQYRDYEIRFDDRTGSFRDFRDRDLGLLEKVLGKKQNFVEDLLEALGLPDFDWKGPSWDCFYHAVFNGRPVSVITARGHHPNTIKCGIRTLIQRGHLPQEPNYLSLYPVNYPPVRRALQNGHDAGTAELKKAAIRASVEQAFRVYGYSPYHRFGMSDDDPRNLELIMAEMIELKNDYPEVSFFVFDTQKGDLVKREIFRDHTESQPLAKPQQLNLF